MGGASPRPAGASARQRLQLTVRGTVQGVGFRPFVYRTAQEFGIAGSVANTPTGVSIEAEGPLSALARFVDTIRQGPPPPARVTGVAVQALFPVGEAAFQIRPSAATGVRSANILPDLSTCAACLREVFDPGDRRYRYPFTNCTHCGPRYSVIEALPYDRARTSMRRFAMCAACRAEYENPANRRFHAEPNACPACGPKLALWDGAGRGLAEADAALIAAAAAIREGAIVAVKGLGGFHLMVDARNDAAVKRLRARKHREEKPFAVMFPSLAAIDATCDARPEERALLASPERPIVIVATRVGRSPSPLPGEGRGEGPASTSPPLPATTSEAMPGRDPRGQTREGSAGRLPRVPAGARLAASVSPDNPTVGAMLPYTPLHHLLMAELDFPVVATSGNHSEEPIVTDEAEVLARLGGIADFFLVHDRPIVRPVDDSVARIVAGEPLLLRRARGYAPAPAIERDLPAGILAFGGHLKATIAATQPTGAVLSQHIGDLATVEARDAYDSAIADITRLHAVVPRLAVRDLHPDYHSSRVADASGLPTVSVQHHLAHVAACMAEHGLAPPVLGVALDGTGYGPDGTVWGGEFLLVAETGWRRVGHLRPFRLPGGEAAIREPRRSALGLLYEIFGSVCLDMTDLAPIAAFTSGERDVLATMLERGVRAPITTSAGRLFDAVASLLGIRQRCSYEGQAAMRLESEASEESRSPAVAPRLAYSFAITNGDPMVVDWEPAIRTTIADLAIGTSTADFAAAFHHGLASVIAEAAARVGAARVVLSGGCFQNAFLTEATIAALNAARLMPYWHRLVPPNDGGLALGQAAWAARLVERGEIQCA